MSTTKHRGLALFGGMLCASLVCAPFVTADDTELFVRNAPSAARPNVLFIVDTSGSMGAVVEGQAAYDPGTVYEGPCENGRIYWREGAGDPPSCSTGRWIEASALTCEAAREAFDSGAGRLTARFAQYSEAEASWKDLSPDDHAAPVECEDDRGRHGDGSSPAHVYAANGNAAAPWSTSSSDEITWWRLPARTLYSANYLNWYHGPTGPTTRMQIVKDVATALAGSVNGVKIGLMRFNASNGGRLVHPVSDVTANRDALLQAIESLSPSGVTPMAETMYEAALYFLGQPPRFGSDDVGVNADGHYISPVAEPCQKSYIVYLTDGEPSNDTDAAHLAPQLPNFGSLAGPCAGAGDGTCLPELARYLYEIDLAPDLDGKQNVVTYTIGFTLDLPLLAATAEQGGGRYYLANDTQSLSRVLTNIVTAILETQATFTAPAVSVNSFNRTQHLNELFVTVFQPSQTLHWPGNLKKYRLRAEDATIVDANGRPAVDDTGFFSPDAQSFWSPEPDGQRVTLGGAANRLPSPADRRVFTYLPEHPNPILVAPSNAIRADNGLLTASVLGVETADEREAVIRFIRGEDVGDIDNDGNRTEPRNRLGDPLHSQPATLVYGGTPSSSNTNDAVVFFATNDGFLHAIDASTGVEKWAFVAPEFLASQARLLVNEASAQKHYGIDGNLRLQLVNADHDGIIDPTAGEKVYLFFGLRRGGRAYYALDVTNPDAPELVWRLDHTDLPGLGQTWSSPVPTKIKAGSDERYVVIFAGGYDEAQDNYEPRTDHFGNALYIVDSETGELIWHGARSGGTREFPDMRYSIPADVKVIDLDADGFADRMYAADMGGQIWRFDIFNGEPASNLVTGGVIARLGSAGIDNPTRADTRRFYYAPDVALATTRAGTFLHIGIGSGYRAHPNETDNENRFYALRDNEPFRHLTQSEFAARRVIREQDLVDITDRDAPDAAVEPGSDGWMLRLRPGEKVLAEARTFNNAVFFTTFTPSSEQEANSCEPRLGTNRLYIVNLFDGEPVTHLVSPIDDGELTLDGRAVEFRGSLPSEVSFLFPSPDDPESCVGDTCRPRPVVCVDLFCLPTSFGTHPIRTYWRQEDVD